MKKKVVILIGPICAGKGQVSDILQENYHYHYFRFSSSLEAIMYEKYGKITRELYAVVGNELRDKFGPQALAKVTVEQAEKQNHSKIVIDGARNPAEIEYIKNYYFQHQVVSIAVDAPQELRFQRLLSRHRVGDPQKFEDFKASDDRELYGISGKNGHRVKDCMNLADATIENIGDVKELELKIGLILNQLKLL